MIAAKKLYPDATLCAPSSQEKSLKNFFLSSLIYSYPFVRESSIDISSIKTLIIVDTRQESRIGRFSEILGKVKVIIYDHHPPSQDDIKGDEEHVEQVGANTTIMVKKLLKEGIDITPEEASIFLLGIYEDTGKFTYASTTPEDLEIAAKLIRMGGDLNQISPFLSKELTLEQFNLLNELVGSLRKVRVKGVEVGIAEATWESYVLDIAPLAQMVLDMYDLNALFCLFHLKDRVFIVARSKVPELDVGRICERFGGGGHRVAASASVKGIPIAQVRVELLEELKRVSKPLKRVKDLMFKPVKTIRASNTIAEAHEIMAKFGINALPVVDEDDHVVGILTRHVVDRALYHGLGDSTCETFMEREFLSVSPEDDVEGIEEAFLPKGQRFIPVVDGDGRVVGAITRTSLLSFYKELYDISVEKELSRKRRMVKNLLEEKTPKELLLHLKKMGSVAEDLGYRAYIVGGFVRDLLLGIRNYDVDVVVEGDGEKLLKELKARFGYKVTTFSRFKTGSVWFPEGFRVDVATARMEYYERPGRLPVVEESSLMQDLYRRDFSINTLAISITGGSFGELLDFFGGYRDIKDKVIRVLHNLSFVEDPTRIIRAIRFSLKLGFRIGKTTEYLLKDSVKKGFLRKVEGPRIYKELKLIFTECDPIKVLEVLDRYGVFRSVFSYELSDRVKEGLEEVFRVVSWFSIERPGENVRTYLLFLLPIFEGAGDVDSLVSFFKPPKDEEKVILWAKRELPRVAFELDLSARKGELSGYSRVDSEVGSLPIECALYLLSRVSSRRAKEVVRGYIEKKDSLRPSLRGKDLLGMGYKEGPIIGRIMDELRKAVLDGMVKGRKEEEEWVRRNFPLD